MVTFEDIRSSKEIQTYITQADASLKAMGLNEHSFAHALRCADLATSWLLALGYPPREAELAGIAAYMHDIGNVINRHDHAQTGALLAFRLLDKMDMPPVEIAAVVTAIGNHDEATAHPVSPIAAAVILADKTDVRRCRVRHSDLLDFDIHDRVNYAAREAFCDLEPQKGVLILKLDIDTDICQVTDYFEIFLDRMLLCRRAAEFLKLRFQLIINGSVLM